MLTVTCPACGHGFVMRRRGRCRRCDSILVREGEWYVREDGDRVFLWLTDRREWSEVLDRP